jgi:hypothetical protein
VFWKMVARIIVVAFAFLLATLAAIFVVVTLGLERVTGELHRMGPDGDFISTSFSLVDQGLALLAGLSIIPALLVIFVGEIGRIRLLIYYVAGGAASGPHAAVGRRRDAGADGVAGVRDRGLCRRLRLLADRRAQCLRASLRRLEGFPLRNARLGL